MHQSYATIAADHRPRRSQCSFQARRTVYHSPTANDILRSKVSRISSRHEQLKTAYSQLKSQIITGLLEAEEVFASLAIPLVKLVGLKTVEMSEEGRFSSIIINNRDSSHPIYRDFQWNGDECEEGSGSSGLAIMRPNSHQRTSEFEDLNFTSRATKVCKELMHKQKLQLMQLVQLLKQIEIQVNSSKNDILQTLADNRQSLKRLYQKVVTYIYENHISHESNGMSPDTVKLLKFTFEHFGSALGSVEIGVETLISNLASKMCHPMVNYVNCQKSELVAGTCQSLLAMLEEIETAIRIRSQELEVAKKKVKAVEESRLIALTKLKQSEAKLKEMTERQTFIRESRTHSKGLPAPEKVWFSSALHLSECKVSIIYLLHIVTLFCHSY
ncbi:OLC1v1014422C2 [Oldenlandia corymbosa var. corymbosa]|uniref:OLC1v1014422C2 n=1 Tax=Oldenlandia corymbosa var. corymbosa TaxID=529605 RepID=A0AAV1E0M5_OLDCO|nr:OLC1v1014422C2 [Oldenlandia corymbosa var. corymbosa]